MYQEPAAVARLFIAEKRARLLACLVAYFVPKSTFTIFSTVTFCNTRQQRGAFVN